MLHILSLLYIVLLLCSDLAPASVAGTSGLTDRGATLIQIFPLNTNETWEEGSFNFTTYEGIGKS